MNLEGEYEHEHDYDCEYEWIMYMNMNGSFARFALNVDVYDPCLANGQSNDCPAFRSARAGGSVRGRRSACRACQLLLAA